MELGDLTIWRATNTVGQPLCISSGDLSLTVFENDEGEPVGIIAHEYDENEELVMTEATGWLPVGYLEEIGVLLAD